ncbi:hypothetical protein VUN82_12710 [Micrococcaceae bacterium Sec5.1]
MMEILVVYETMYGNTRRVAEAIASGFDGEPGAIAQDIDANVGIREWLAQLRPAIPGQKAAAFDTRNHGPAFLTGRASKHITSGLRKAGFELIAEPESFEVSQEPSISEDEFHRAARWGKALAALIDTRK